MINSIPSALLQQTNPQSREKIYYPTEEKKVWIAGGIVSGSYPYLDSHVIHREYASTRFSLGAVYVDVWWNPIDSLLWFGHSYHIAWIFWWTENLRESPIQWSDVITNALNANVSKIVMYCDCPKTYDVYILNNSTSYASLYDAWVAGEITVQIGMGWEASYAVINAWTLITQLMLFQAPNIHPLLNGIIVVPIWAMIGYLVWRLITYALHL